jgi:SnoaL-like domain
MAGEVEFLKLIYAPFNTRDLETVPAGLHEDVMWANGMEGGHVHGRGGVRSYWTRQWAMVDPHVTPIAFSTSPNGEVVVEVHQSRFRVLCGGDLGRPSGCGCRAIDRRNTVQTL